MKNGDVQKVCASHGAKLVKMVHPCVYESCGTKELGTSVSVFLHLLHLLVE